MSGAKEPTLLQTTETQQSVFEADPKFDPSKHDSSDDLLKGLVGLVQLICHRSDTPSEIAFAMKTNHRFVDAMAYLKEKFPDEKGEPYG
jgi:hypothetical protein